jgi:hypothetical protein
MMIRCDHDNVTDAEDDTPEGDAQSSTNDIGNEASNEGTN